MKQIHPIVIRAVRPSVDCGQYVVKRTVGDTVEVSAEIVHHGSELLIVQLLHRRTEEEAWERVPMVRKENDLWAGSFMLKSNDYYTFTIEAWVDEFGTWLENARKWMEAGEDVGQDILHGIRLVERAAERAGRDGEKLREMARSMKNLGSREALDLASSEEILRLMSTYQKKKHFTILEGERRILAEREIARYSAWYEIFPRSYGKLIDCVRVLDHAREMGFNVLYLTPIHPVGKTGRRGRNGTGAATASDPGSPWAIGSHEGGHKSIDSRLGNMEDFLYLLSEAKRRGMEIAMDIAFQCSPDHPYVREHPEWFQHRPDGTIRYAENPPKKYYDIYPFDFDTEDREGLWNELKSIFEFWMDRGVRIFRVDNPHTKPLDFWKWLIEEIRAEHRDIVLLSEAFTRPALMYELARIGFSQSYTYFTWKNFDWEIEQYFSEIYSGGITDFFRPNLFTNTPDILPFVLQNGGRPAFMIRALLAATLSPSWGIYSGFELCENEALPGREEYLNSEKYEIRHRDWKSEGNISDFISRLNRIREEHYPFQLLGNVRFHSTGNHNIVMYTREGRNPEESLLTVVNLNPFQRVADTVRVPHAAIGGSEKGYWVTDLLSGEDYFWGGTSAYIELTPGIKPGHVLSLKR